MPLVAMPSLKAVEGDSGISRVLRYVPWQGCAVWCDDVTFAHLQESHLERGAPAHPLHGTRQTVRHGQSGTAKYTVDMTQVTRDGASDVVHQ